ncbi:hypothetical protein CCACVL1_26331 [Corchorus capsularis]|uniref:Uncharacterized protein n=1 Tax=Corchorus capsularis TaxID=210143 RepID=A0A1R3GF69_COCAP|nr:hypothetical protein CCACVL1_26331 [Corchorus capsularis]
MVGGGDFLRDPRAFLLNRMGDSKGKAKLTYHSISSSSSDEEDELESESEEEEDDDDYEEGGELESLSLKECKAYLRKHGLRLTGTKEVCQQRILEHWKIKNGNAEALYPRSSFYINCTGDVCKGDVVLFTQKVFEKFDKVTRHGKVLGRRTVVGRVVKESYGKAKQQHTFTVEVLWSKGIKKLPPLFPLLVKGRNLYKLKTYRQRWSDEAERRKVLAEKHRRGDAARLVKTMNQARRNWSTDVGAKRKMHLCNSRPLKKRKPTEPEKGKLVNTRGKASIPRHANMSNKFQATSQGRQVNKKQKSRSRVSNSSYSHQKPVHLSEGVGAAHYSCADPVPSRYHSETRSNHRSTPVQFASYNMGSTSSMVRPLPFRPYIDSWTRPSAQYRESKFNHHSYTHHANSNPGFYHK